MNMELLQKIDSCIEECRNEIAKTTIELVNIRSVQGAPLPGAPFGEGPRRMLDKALEMGREAGFYPVDYNVGVVSMALKDSKPDVGIWIHGDVVPEGIGWNFEPYNAVEYKGCIIGRGATDNKGQMAAIYHLLKIFKELNIELNYNPALYVGSNEETGMRDLNGLPGNEDARGFLNVCEAPKLSLVPDSSFPVGYGGKGSIKALIRTKTPLEGFVLTAGQDEAPARATAVFPPQENFPQELSDAVITKDSEGNITVTMDTVQVHGNSSKSGGNAIVKMCEALKAVGTISANDLKILDAFRLIAEDTTGACLNVAGAEDSIMGPMSTLTKRIDWEDGYPVITTIVYYPIGVEYDGLVENMTAAAETLGLEVIDIPYSKKPYLLDTESETAKMLCRVANEVTGDDKPMYIVKGGTYAHFLPNAYAFGMDGSLPPDDFPAGRGGAHGVDEAVSLDRLQRAMKIYARALLALNEMCI